MTVPMWLAILIGTAFAAVMVMLRHYVLSVLALALIFAIDRFLTWRFHAAMRRALQREHGAEPEDPPLDPPAANDPRFLRPAPFQGEPGLEPPAEDFN